MKKVILPFCVVFVLGLVVGCDGDYEVPSPDGAPDQTPNPDGTPPAGNPGGDKTPGEQDNVTEGPGPRSDIEEQFANIDFDAAPTLGDAARRYYRILIDRDWAGLWEMLSEKSRQSYEDREQWSTYEIPDEEMQYVDTPKDYYIKLMQHTMPKIKRLDAITGEKIDSNGKSGYLYNDIGKTYEFVLEDGQWKLAYLIDLR